MTLSPLLKRLLYVAGSVIALLSVVFVVSKLNEHAAEIDFTRFSGVEVTVFASLAIIYGASNLILAAAWRDLLRQQQVMVTRLWSSWAFGISQLAKYVPGNIFHLAGRQAIGVAAGLPGWPLARSIAWELGLIAVMAVPFILLTVPLLLESESLIPVVALAFIAVVIMMAEFAHRRWSSHLRRAVWYYTGFLLISSLVFVVVTLLGATLTMTPAGLLGICGAYVIAWLAGLITPGAPAGIGVREVVLYAFLNPVISQGDLLMVILIGRTITVGGDLLYFALALLFSMLRPRPLPLRDMPL